MIFRVFVSGNQTELEKERFAVKEAIEEDGILNEYFKVFLFEELPAASKDPVSSFLEKVKRAISTLGYLVINTVPRMMMDYQQLKKNYGLSSNLGHVEKFSSILKKLMKA